MLGARPHYDSDSVITGVIVGLREDHAPGVMEAVPAVPDRLTGLAERHEFTRRLRAVLGPPEAAAADWEHQGVVVLAVNLDSFRNLNNLHGFEVGDQVLRAVARAIAETVRDGDVPARFGGEEFAVLLRHATREVAIEVRLGGAIDARATGADKTKNDTDHDTEHETPGEGERG